MYITNLKHWSRIIRYLNGGNARHNNIICITPTYAYVEKDFCSRYIDRPGLRTPFHGIDRPVAECWSPLDRLQKAWQELLLFFSPSSQIPSKGNALCLRKNILIFYHFTAGNLNNDTNTRRIAYRRNSPDSYDMLMADDGTRNCYIVVTWYETQSNRVNHVTSPNTRFVQK